uniref:Rho-GAP domain-containing protein n=1 Tax=Wuchereria bancrofti TaxID=6293 RepID=A0AAF5PU93_WUCBA
MDKYLDGLRSMRLYRQANTLPTTSGPQQFTLENVASYTMELDIGDRRGFSTFTLRGVPVFLVDAFNFLRLNGLDASGIFRKEGNISRLKSFSMQTFFGSVVLPEDCTTHDVCSLIKRFFRELKIPLFAQMQRQLLDAASIYDGAQRIDKLLEVVRMLPTEHLATLTFLMRQLKYFGDRHEGHQMTVENIARVFAPSLFRDDPPLSSNKRKRGSQEDLISNVRNENELRIAIIVDLIDNAHKIGVPRDYYLASRRPSDVSQKIFKGKFMGYVGMRSVSAKPSSRNTASVKQKTETRKEKKLEKQPSGKFAERYKSKIPRERRSSSTVRDFFSNISNKVLRRGLSPVTSTRRRCSAGDITDDESLRGNMTGLNDTTPKFCVRNYADTCDAAQHASRMRFENTELLSESSDLSMNIKSPSSIVSSPQKIVGKRSQTILVEANDCALSSRKDDAVSIPTKSSRHRSRRESPRKSNTNSRSKAMEKYKVIKELKEANIMPASPAFEPIEMTTKNIGEAFLKHKNSDEKLAVSTIIKRNSSKKLLQSVKIADSAQSFLEGYSTGRVIDRIHRRHTAPVKTSTLLKRNQPNSVTTGLKTPQSRARERYSTTLSLRLNGMDKDSEQILEKKKRRSESLSGDSNGKISVNDGEDKITGIQGTQAFSAEALLEQKCMESRQRRAKRQKRREVSDSVQTISVQCTAESTPMTSLLDDVTNEINRLERDRKVANKLLRDEGNSLLSLDTMGEGRDLDSISTKEDIPPPSLPSVSSPTNNSSVSAISSVVRENRARRSSPDFSKHSLYSPPVNTSVQSATLFINSSSTITPAFNKTLHVEPLKHISNQRNVDSVHGGEDARGNSIEGNNRPNDFEEDFSKSDAIKMQLLNARSEDDIVAGPAYMSSGLRPSVLSIKSNNRGMVRQRVSHFARLGTQKTTPEQGFKIGRQWQDGKYASSSLQKLSAPPASHGLQPIAGGNVSPPSREIVMRRAKKFEALATSVGMEVCKNFRPATRNRLAKIQKQNISKTPRRLSGEMRVMRRSQARLDKSLEKLAVSLSNRRLLGRSPSQFGCNKLHLLNGSRSEERQRVERSLVRTSCHGDLGYVNPSIMPCATNLKMILEREE